MSHTARDSVGGDAVDFVSPRLPGWRMCEAGEPSTSRTVSARHFSRRRSSHRGTGTHTATGRSTSETDSCNYYICDRISDGLGDVSVSPGQRTLLRGNRNVWRALTAAITAGRQSQVEAISGALGRELCQLRGEYSETALHVAVVNGNVEAAETLIDDGGAGLVLAQYTVPNYEGVTALHQAVALGHADLVQYILTALDDNAKAAILDVEARGLFKHWSKPLLLAAYTANVAILTVILKAASPLFTQDAEGCNIIHTLALAASHERNATKARRMVGRLGSNVTSDIAMTSSEAYTAILEVIRSSELTSELSDPSDPVWKLLWTSNNIGLTPLALATSLGCLDLAAAILLTENVYIFPQWHCGPAWATFYNVIGLDPATSSAADANVNNLAPTAKYGGKPRGPSVLDLVVYSYDDSRHLEFLDLPPIRRLADHKWGKYKALFYGWGIFHFLLISAFTFHVLYPCEPAAQYQAGHPATNNTGNESIHHRGTPELPMMDNSPAPNMSGVCLSPCSSRDMTPVVARVFAIVGALLYLVSELWDIGVAIHSGCRVSNGLRRCVRSRRRHLPPVALSVVFKVDLYRFFQSAFAILTLETEVARYMCQDHHALTAALAALSGWIFVLSFTRAFKNISIFTVMMQRVLTDHLWYFTVVFLIFFMGFATAMNILIPPALPPVPAAAADTDGHFLADPMTGFWDLPPAFFNLTRFLVGLHDYDATLSRHPAAVQGITVLIIVFINIQLLNMVIAAMNETFIEVKKQKEILWIKSRTKGFLLLERRLPRCLRPKHGLIRAASSVSPTGVINESNITCTPGNPLGSSVTINAQEMTPGEIELMVTQYTDADNGNTRDYTDESPFSPDSDSGHNTIDASTECVAQNHNRRSSVITLLPPPRGDIQSSTPQDETDPSRAQNDARAAPPSLGHPGRERPSTQSSRGSHRASTVTQKNDIPYSAKVLLLPSEHALPYVTMDSDRVK